jgi:lipopolysaccharide/colanic/teichoic acid biosynthesis glycosyltransferase
MIAKRVFDLFWTVPGLIVLSPLMVGLAIWIRLDSPGPALFRQERVGRFGKPFRVVKFRTMTANAEERGPKITAGADPRITRAGAFLRKSKLDELPQLFNVLKGEMSLVGPRPEVPEYVAQYPDDVRERVLSVPPGITDFAAIEFRNESELLANSQNPEDDYLNKVLPRKLAYYERYVTERNMWVDFVLILRTMVSVITH